MSLPGHRSHGAQPNTTSEVLGLEPAELYVHHLPPAYARANPDHTIVWLRPDHMEAVAEARTALDVLTVTDDGFAEMLSDAQTSLTAAVLADRRRLSAAALQALAQFRDNDQVIDALDAGDVHSGTVADLVDSDVSWLEDALMEVQDPFQLGWYADVYAHLLSSHRTAFTRALAKCGYDGPVDPSTLAYHSVEMEPTVLFGAFIDTFLVPTCAAAVRLVWGQTPAPPWLHRNRFARLFSA